MADIKYICRNLKVMSFGGLWDYYQFENPVKRFLFAMYGKSIFYIFSGYVTSAIIEMYLVRNDMSELMQNISLTLLQGIAALKAFMIIFKKYEFDRLLEKIRSEEQRIFAAHKEEETEVYTKNVDNNWFVTRFFIFVCYSSIVFFFTARPADYFILGPQEIHNYKIPLVFSSWFPFDKYADEYFKYAFSFQIFIGCIGTYYIALTDTFLYAFIIFAIGQFKLIQFSIRNLYHLTNEEKAFLEDNDIKDIYPKIVEIIKHHNRIIDYVSQLDHLLKPIIFVNFLFFSILLCAVGLEAIIAGKSVRLLLSVYFLTALLIQLFLYYWHANEVTLESINVGQAVCESEWFNFSPRAKKALLLVLIRTHKPVVLSVGGFYPMSLNTYVMILRGAYSFLALFRRMYSRQNELDEE